MNGLVNYETESDLAIVTITRPEVRNAVNRETAEALANLFRRFNADDSLRVAILTGTGWLLLRRRRSERDRKR